MLLTKNDLPSLFQVGVHQQAYLYVPPPLFPRRNIRKENDIDVA